MTKKEIVKVIADNHTEFTQKEVGEIIDAFLDEIKSEVSQGKKIAIPKFGSFESVERAARECKNPQTNERMTVPPCKIMKFKPSSSVKKLLNA